MAAEEVIVLVPDEGDDIFGSEENGNLDKELNLVDVSGGVDNIADYELFPVNDEIAERLDNPPVVPLVAVVPI